MARQPKKEIKNYYKCPKCNGTFLDVTTIYNGNIVYSREFDCQECDYAWNDRGIEL
jgi:hypothetical protein